MSFIIDSIPVQLEKVLVTDFISPVIEYGYSSFEESSLFSNDGYRIFLLDNLKVVIPRE
jgi:hypothetical protein